jgi:hypothetical protein
LLGREGLAVAPTNDPDRVGRLKEKGQPEREPDPEKEKPNANQPADFGIQAPSPPPVLIFDTGVPRLGLVFGLGRRHEGSHLEGVFNLPDESMVRANHPRGVVRLKSKTARRQVSDFSPTD